jgi:hypothetical protein
MTGVDEVSVGNARCAEVPVGAVEALVTNTINVLVTSITDSIVANVTARSEQSLRDEIKLGLLNSRLESMLGVVAMLHANMARNAKIIVGARSASDKVLLRQFLNARIASASSNWNLQVFRVAWCSLWLGWSRLGCNCLCCAVDDLSILNKTLDHPVILTTAKNAVVHTGLTQIKVTIIAGTAMIMFIWDSLAAVVAVD